MCGEFSSCPPISYQLTVSNSDAFLKDGDIPCVYRHNLNVSFKPRTVHPSPSSSTTFFISSRKRGAIRDQSRDARPESINTSRSRTVVGVTFEGIKFVCASIIEVHSIDVRRSEIKYIERGGERVWRRMVWRVGCDRDVDREIMVAELIK